MIYRFLGSIVHRRNLCFTHITIFATFISASGRAFWFSSGSMLHRGTSDVSNRLRRSNSSTSVYSRRPGRFAGTSLHTNPVGQHAITAAHIAMERASRRSPTSTRESIELITHSSNEPVTITSAAAKPGKGRSDRDADLTALPIASSPLTLPVKTPEDRSSVRAREAAVSEAARHNEVNDFGLLDGYASIPSSYRRLRKSNSMLSHQRRSRSNQDFKRQGHGTPRTLRHFNSTIDHQDRGLRLGLRRSMSFLKSNSESLSQSLKRSHSTVGHRSRAAGRTPDQCLAGFSPRTWNTRLGSPPVPDSQRPLHNYQHATSEAGDGTQNWHEEQLNIEKSRRRSFSASIRETIRRIFARSPAKCDSIPVQQVDASRPHFVNDMDGFRAQDKIDDFGHDYPFPKSPRSLYIPSGYQAETPEPRSDTISQGLKCIRSSNDLASNGQSRLTSWTNSTMSDCSPGRATPVDRKRLSIIQENGVPHQSSLSSSQCANKTFCNSIDTAPFRGTPTLTSPVDSHRVYSALMRRIEREREEANRTETPTPQAYQHPGTSPITNSGVVYSAPTIGQGPPEGSTWVGSSGGSDRQPSLESSAKERRQKGTFSRMSSGSCNPAWQSRSPSNEHMRLPMSNMVASGKPKKADSFSFVLSTGGEQVRNSDEDDSSVIVTRQHRGDDLETASESQYSCTLSGRIMAADRAPSPAGSIEEATGMQTIVPLRLNRQRCSLPRQHDISRANARSALEQGPRGNFHSLDADRLRMGRSHTHYREDAQIDGDDTTVGGNAVARPEPAQTLSQHISENKGSRRNDNRSSLELREMPKNTTSRARSHLGLSKKASSMLPDIRPTVDAAAAKSENVRIPSTHSGNSSFYASHHVNPSQPKAEATKRSSPWLKAQNHGAPREKKGSGYFGGLLVTRKQHLHSGTVEASADDHSKPWTDTDSISARHASSHLSSGSSTHGIEFYRDVGRKENRDDREEPNDVSTSEGKASSIPRPDHSPPAAPPPILPTSLYNKPDSRWNMSQQEGIAPKNHPVPQSHPHPLPPLPPVEQEQPPQLHLQRQQKKRARRLLSGGGGVGGGRSISSSRRMVSNFLRSRRKTNDHLGDAATTSSGGGGGGGGDDDDSKVNPQSSSSYSSSPAFV